jgi:hypothetical protein
MAKVLQTHSVGLFIRQKEPANLETPLDQVDSYLTPTELFDIRCLTVDWLTPTTPGRYTLLARAKGTDGSVQPDKHAQSHGTYAINHPLPIEVFVENQAVSSR